MASQVVPLQSQEIEYLQTEMNQSSMSREIVPKSGHSSHQKRGTVQLFNEKDEQVNSIVDLTIIMIGIMSGSFTFGYAITYLTLSFDTVFDHIELKGTINEEQGLFSAILPIGCIVGAVSSHFLMQVLTRNQTLIIADICGMLSILSLVPIREMILAFRFMYGVCNGISCIVMPIYIKELCPQKYYERFSVMAGFLIGIGVLTAYIMALGYLNPDLRGPNTYWWQLMFALPPVVFFFRQLIVTVIYQMDSPISLLEKGLQLQAKNVVERLYTKSSVEQAFLKAQLRVQYNEEHKEGLIKIFSKKHCTTVSKFQFFYYSLKTQKNNLKTLSKYSKYIGFFLNKSKIFKLVLIYNEYFMKNHKLYCLFLNIIFCQKRMLTFRKNNNIVKTIQELSIQLTQLQILY
ncbi:unnamed protein product [Paramecium primaurelia]|uniref:Major facilitator superfamily (MFS) profile domain-containing protein n=1 Tax=Paramecium primaurelia TaxID=5886 RepID=A0A8S1MIC7_PARPR|nr:unnamed protein product [Paramecium primaurelia]